MALNLPFGIQPINPLANLDQRYGPWATCVGALSGTSGTRVCGLTVGIVESGQVVEYWFTGTTDGSLIKKTVGSTSTSLSEFTITGNSTNTGFTVTHNKNKTFVGVEIVKNSSPYPTVYTSVSRPTTNTVCVTFDAAPANGQEFKILIIS